MSKNKHLKIAEPFIGKEEEAAVLQVLKSKNLTQGKNVELFEHKFADFLGTKYAVAVGNGTCALFLSLIALEIGKGDEVITTPFTFISTTNAITFTGATPVFVDITNTLNIDVSKIEQKITRKTKAILPVHLFGQAAQMKEIMNLASKHKLSIIEDAAQAHGATFQGKKVGSFGDLGCFSFYGTKNMTTGEGGMITTSSKKLYEKLLLLRNIGMRERYRYELVGYNYRMTEIQAAMGLVQLKKLTVMNTLRTNNARIYDAMLEGVSEIELPQVEDSTPSVNHQYCLLLKNRNVRQKLQTYLENHNIQTAIYYPNSITELSFYKTKEIFPVSSNISKRILAIPVHPGITVTDAKFIALTILSFFNKKPGT